MEPFHCMTSSNSTTAMDPGLQDYKIQLLSKIKGRSLNLKAIRSSKQNSVTNSDDVTL